MTLYGITSCDSMSKNPCRMAELQDYPVPLLMPFEHCTAYIEKYYADRRERFNPKVEPEARCWQLVKQMVEVHSGRRRAVDGAMVVVDEHRPTYDQLLERSHRFSGVPWKDRNEDRLNLYRVAMMEALKPRMHTIIKPKMKRRDNV